MRIFIASLALMILGMHGALAEPVATTQPSFMTPKLTISLTPGSLQKNILRIANAHGWPVVWKAKDFAWVGNVEVSGSMLVDVMEKVLGKYPLQATFYEGNHVLVITPRNLL